MTRRKPLLLAAFALLGAGALALLLTLLAAEDPPVRERSTPMAADPREAATGDGAGAASGTGPRGGGRVTWEQRHGDAPYQVVEGGREPFDSPEYRRLVHERGLRVIEIIAEIREAAPEDGTKRHNLHRELETLLRQLGSRVDPAVRDELIAMLFEVEDRWRPLVGGALGQLRGDKETAKKLVALLDRADSNVFTRSAILNALGNMDVPDVLPDLLARIGEGYEGEDATLRAIGQLADTGTRLKLLERLQGPLRPESEREIVNVLGQSADPQVLAQLKERLGEAPPAERSALIQILGMTRDPAHAEAVLPLVARDVDEQVRQSAIRALGEFGDAASGRKLLELVQTGSDVDRIWATNAIYRIREPETVEALAGEWDDLTESGRLALVGAGKNLPRPDGRIVDVAMEGIHDGNRKIRQASAYLLGRSRQERAIEPLVKMMQTGSHLGEQSVAVAALLNIGTKEAAQRGLEVLWAIENERQRESYGDQFRKILARHESQER